MTTYDGAGNRTGMDVAGALTSYLFDGPNRLTEVYPATGSDVTFVYDPDGWRVQKEVGSELASKVIEIENTEGVLRAIIVLPMPDGTNHAMVLRFVWAFWPWENSYWEFETGWSGVGLAGAIQKLDDRAMRMFNRYMVAHEGISLVIGGITCAPAIVEAIAAGIAVGGYSGALTTITSSYSLLADVDQIQAAATQALSGTETDRALATMIANGLIGGGIDQRQAYAQADLFENLLLFLPIVADAVNEVAEPSGAPKDASRVVKRPTVGPDFSQPNETPNTPNTEPPNTEPLNAQQQAGVRSANPNGLTAAESWGRPGTLDDHFARHGADFGAASAEEYAQQASRFLQESQARGLPTKIGPDGAIRVYDPSTNAFGSFNANGTTRTFYQPNPAQHGYPTNLDYWNAQPGGVPWSP